MKSILETTADSGIAVLHRGGRAAIYGRVAQHERMSPLRAEAYKAKSIEFLDAALKSRSSTLVPARKASSETTIMQSLILRKFLSFILSLQARTRGRAAIHGRVAAMQKNVAL